MKRMKRMKRIIPLLTVIGVLLGSSLSVSAKPDNLKTSELWANPGKSAYTSVTSTTTARRTTWYVQLKAFKLNHYPENNMPRGNYFYASLYDSNTKATVSASFDKPTNKHYNYKYSERFGGKGEKYRLKSYCSYTTDGGWSKYEWSANPY